MKFYYDSESLRKSNYEMRENGVWFGQVDFKGYLVSDVTEYLVEWNQASEVNSGLKIYHILFVLHHFLECIDSTHNISSSTLSRHRSIIWAKYLKEVSEILCSIYHASPYWLLRTSL